MGDPNKYGQGIRGTVEKRRDELEKVLAHIGQTGSQTTRRDIEAALKALAALMTGDLDHIPQAVSTELTKWLNNSKYLGLKEMRELGL
jgi:hypothetical protein